jgi:RTX calcium-binding nonapeptide repeat (4 copies)
MRITVWIATLTSLLMPAWLGSASAGASVGADLRVVGSSGELDDITQYSDTTTMPTSPQADCFGPGSGGSGQGVPVQGANDLGIVVEAAKSRNRLNPLLLTDKFVPDGFGLGVCGIGGNLAQASAFWYTKVNHTGLQVGGSQFPIRAGDQVLWYLAPTSPPPAELVLNAPVREPLGTPFPVQVLAYGDDGIATPAAGAVISGGATPVTADASGNAQVTMSGPGAAQIQATRGAEIPSAALAICSAAQIGDCPMARGRIIVGSDDSDVIAGTAGDDRIKPRAGNDGVRALAGADRVDVRGGGKDRVNCGGGDDSVKADKRDKLAKNCEHRSRSTKEKGKHKGARGKK